MTTTDRAALADALAEALMSAGKKELYALDNAFANYQIKFHGTVKAARKSPLTAALLDAIEEAIEARLVGMDD